MNKYKLLRNLNRLLLSLVFITNLTACDILPNSKYPIHLTAGKDISDSFISFNFEPHKLTTDEIISIGINIKGNTICYDRQREYRLCSMEIYSQDPTNKFELPPELKFDPDKKYTEEESKDLKAKTEVIDAKFRKEFSEPWLNLMETLPKVDLDVVAIDSAGKEYPFIYIGSGAGYCSSEKDQMCNQYNLDKNKVKVLGDNPLVGMKIRNKQVTDISISNIYVVEKYKRS